MGNKVTFLTALRYIASGVTYALLSSQKQPLIHTAYSRTTTANKIKHVPTVPTPWPSPGSFTCKSDNVVYLIMCLKCSTTGLYVEETGQTLHHRMNSHRFNIKHGNTDAPAEAHFCSNTSSKIFRSQF
ncbi:hypothetical protein XELAEV_18014961mg [Xenopus laevis]|uniref:GIY-YIG domain-containing protein n=1 Tax=Xenopus laevis TaxID=8355 RepID=A0A974DH42_XENLA|nr:hypothetical protein XELAEV_18014961mg [Xenopus laevis]